MNFKRKLNGSIVLCSLFLSLTALVFQPLAYFMANQENLQADIGAIWWKQLLVGLAAALILSLLMHLFPEKIGRALASAALGGGIAYLVQVLLFGDGKPLQMNTNWPMEMLNIHVWFGIVIFVTGYGIYYGARQARKTDLIKRIICWILIILQALSLIILSMSADLTVRNGIQNQYSEKHIIRISMERGLPYLITKAIFP